MTFFYDLNKRLKDVLDAPKSEHKQLNERDMSRAAKGYEKYGKEGMEALAKAGREGKALDPIRDKYNKYNESGEEGLGDVARKVGGAVKKVAGKALDTLGHGSDEELRKKMQRDMGATGAQVHGKPSMAIPNKERDSLTKEAAKPMTAKQKSFAKLAPPADKITFADKIAGAKKEVDEMLGDVAAEAMKNALGGGKKVVADEGSTGDYSAKKARAGKDIGKPGKNFAKIAKGAAERYGSEERGKKVAGAVLAKLRKKGGAEEMEEGWDDMMKSVRDRAEKPKVGSVERGHKHDIEHTATGRKVTRRVDDQGHSVGADDDTEGKPQKKSRGRPKGTGTKVGAKGPSGKSKLMTKESASEDDIQILVRMRDEAFEEGNKMLGNKIEDILQMLEGDEEQVNEKAVSKKQQRFMGMVHAAQKGEKPASKEVAKVAKSMGKKDAEDFAATKHKGLPEKKRPEGKKKEKTEEAGGTGTPTASSGFSFGKGIYDSYNRDLEDMIAESMSRLDATLNESMSVNMSNSTEGGKSLTITATDDDAMKLASILKMAGLGGGDDHGAITSDHGVVPDEGGCGCETSPCSCEEQVHEVDENQPDYPTNTETSNDALQYSGGLNAPKSTGQTTVPVIASQEERQQSYAEAEEAAIKRMMEMAGIKEAKKDVEEEKTDEGNLFTGNLAKARAAGKKEADLDGDGDMEKVRESVDDSILAATRNLWKTYQPK